MTRLKIEFTPEAFDDYKYWQQNNKKIHELLQSINRDGLLEGIGRPEALRGNLSGLYSRRIDREHRLVYKMEKEKITIITCKYHY